MTKRGPKPKFHKGNRVYYLKTHVLSPEATLEVGTIFAYNPAVKGSYLVTEGKPFYTIRGESGTDVYDVLHVAAYTPAGYRYLLDVKAYLYLQRVSDILRSAAVGVVAVAKRMRDPRVPGGLPYGAKYDHIMHTPEELRGIEKAERKSLQKEAVAAVNRFTKEAKGRTKNRPAPADDRGRRPKRVSAGDRPQRRGARAGSRRGRA